MTGTVYAGSTEQIKNKQKRALERQTKRESMAEKCVLVNSDRGEF